MTERAARLRERLLQRYPDSELEQLTLQPDAAARPLPADYLEFLAGVGCGPISDGRYMFYSGPLEPGEMFGAGHAAKLPDTILVGDNFAGDVLAYAFRGGAWTLIEIDHTAPGRRELGTWTDIFAFAASEFLGED